MSKGEHTVGDLVAFLLQQPRDRVVELHLMTALDAEGWATLRKGNRVRIVQVRTEDRDGERILILEVGQ